MARKRGRSLVISFAARRIEQLAPLLSIDNANAQLFTTSTAFSGTLRFLFRISFHAFDSSLGIPVHSPIRRSGEQHQYLISCSRDSYSSYRVAPVANDKSFKELSGLLSLTWYKQKYMLYRFAPRKYVRRIEH
ncbi:MAG: hypothetical protein K8R52_12125 [Bacteroidales bacterium]|nr:hypothetical protein [Bacteroidales bacterium]